MGNCVSFAPEGKPTCTKCGKAGDKNWSDMSGAERAIWIWPSRNEPCQCKACLMKAEMEKIKYEKERKYYEKAKDQLYPRPEKQETLRRINSKETWEGTQSFYESWRLPSKLANMLQPFIGERKGTGFVGDTSGAAGAGGSGGDGASGSGGASCPHTSQLEQLDEELEAVEEESLHGSEEGSVHSTRSTPHAVAVGA